MRNQKKNLEFLLRNKENIKKNYIKKTDSLINAIQSEDDNAIKEELIKASDQNFLSGIIRTPAYNSFTDELIDELKQEIPKDRQIRIPFKKVKVKKKPTLKKPGKLRAKKGKRQGWKKAEERRIKTLIKSDVASKDIIMDLNSMRLEKGFRLRTSSSVYTKISRLKKELREGN